MDADAPEPIARDRNALRARIGALLPALTQDLIEREHAARMVLLAALAGEHVLLLGPPGTGKSAMARRLHALFAAAPYFERLLTRFTVPEELFGPLSIRALERDEFVRRTEAYLPCASVVFLDEVFKANSAILNSLLTILQEREFDNGTRREKTPLVCLVAASNELPEGEELAALLDRFLVRLHVAPVSSENFAALLRPEEPARPPDEARRLRPEELAFVREGARSVALPESVRGLIAALRAHLAAQKLYVSDRRWRKIAALLQVAAHTEGRDAVSLLDCRLLAHCTVAGDEPAREVAAWLDARIHEALSEEPRRFFTILRTTSRIVDEESARREPVGDADGRALYVDEAGADTLEPALRRPLHASNGDALYLPPADSTRPAYLHSASSYTARELWSRYFAGDVAALEAYVHDQAHWAWEEVARERKTRPARYSAAHIAARLRQLEALASDLDSLWRALAAHLRDDAGDDTTGDARNALWQPTPAADTLRHELRDATLLLTELRPRIAALRAQIEALPRSEP